MLTQARTRRSDDNRREYCTECGEKAPQRAKITIEQTHGDAVVAENVKFARVPCRTTVCLRCGATSRERMNE
ncbi:DUF7835 family putative zinc beta-ribbon protein [Halegenticoccus tardaugens]|uniref:DUF7835 family putative zinc beta-ribbon protein n=1 Tax=Halegenticoccus tardaugens TaxID=2071624 RepID=UPI00100C0A3C|nr:hypothetical protein [Halegenticoccus tardaugens]